MSTSDDELASIAQKITFSDDMTITADSLGANSKFANGDQHVEQQGQAHNQAGAHPGQDDVERNEYTPRPGDNEERGQSDNYQELEKRIHSLSHQVALLLDRIYEIQELRHSSLPSTSSAPSRIDDLLSSLSDSTLLLRPQISSLASAISTHTGAHKEELQDGIEGILEDWKKVEDQEKWLREEMKEDGWLIRFRTTADQAEAMINPLQRSLVQCQAYVERISNSPSHVPLKAEFDDQLSIERLQKIFKGHESMTRTYIPSINKILKMMDKSITDRPIKNGESLRRFTELSQKWISLQKQLQQINARIRLFVFQHRPEMEYIAGGEDVETLVDVASPYSSIDSKSDYFGYGNNVKSRESTVSSYGSARTRESGYGATSRPAQSHRSSISSGTSSTSFRTPATRQPLPHTHTSPPVKPPSSTLSPETAMRPLPLRRKTSMMSMTSSTTARTPAEKPRWNSSPKVPPEPVQTPTMPRRLGNHPRSDSPASSNASVTSAVSRRLSRIPIASPIGKSGTGYSSPSGRSEIGTEEISLPGLTVSNSHTRTMLTEPSFVNRGQGQSQNHLERARMGLKTPEPPRPRLSSTFSSFSKAMNGNLTTPNSMGSRTSSSGTVPRTVPLGGRSSLGGMTRGTAPPSSFRITSPTPSGRGDKGSIRTPSSRPQSRSGSRLSMISNSYSTYPTIDQSTPFLPSKYDLLDQEIQKILNDTGFTERLFVSRLDEPLKRGQRKLENEEWKGEFIFGKKEKPTGVKLLSIAGFNHGHGQKSNSNLEKRVKCLIRVGGQWLDLKAELERRLKIHDNEVEVEDDDETF